MRLDGRDKSLRRRRFLAVFATAIVGPAAGVRAADTSWLDVESRIQYAYFTEDARALRNLEPLASGDPEDRFKGYYAALLAYRLTLLATADNPAPNGRLPAEGSKGDVRQMVERCVSNLDHALQVRSDFADALALQSACLAMLADRSSLRAPFAGPKSRALIRKALQLAPKNPRVLLLDAVGDYEHPNVLVSDERTLGKFKNAVAAFEAERTDLDQVPGWGAPEAYVWLARCYLNRGDAVAARDALERAILIAPEFALARRLLVRITSG